VLKDSGAGYAQIIAAHHARTAASQAVRPVS
jgi:hypothetical protein